MNNKHIAYLLGSVIVIGFISIWLNYCILGPELINVSYTKLYQMNFQLALKSSCISLLCMLIFTIIVLYLHKLISEDIDSDFLEQ